MKMFLPILMLVISGAWTAAAQKSTSVQAGSSTQAHTSLKAEESGKQVSGRSSASSSTSAATSARRQSLGLSDGTKISGVLVGSLDAKKNKPGDRVEVRTVQDVKQHGTVVLKRGTLLMGHVTRVRTHAKGHSQSQMGIVFDHAVLPNHRQIPLHAAIQALAEAQNSVGASMMGSDGSDEMMASEGTMGAASGMASGGLVGGVASTVGAATGTMMNTAGGLASNAGTALNATARSEGAVGGLTSTGHLASNSSGVFGLQGLSLNSAASSATQGSMIVSSTRNVHLSDGTQMLLDVSGEPR